MPPQNLQAKPTTNHADRDAALERELAALKAEHDRLRDEKLRTEQNLIMLRQQMEELRAKAEAEYGTADPEALEKLLEEKRAENARLVEEYKAHIAGVKKSLGEVEKG